MSNKLKEVLSQLEHQEFATETGRAVHAKIQHIFIKKDVLIGDKSLCEKISSHPNLLSFFDEKSKTEVPVAGYINGRFVSRRIDRLVINDNKKEVNILDYKTDVDKSTFHDKYVAQIKEYVTLLSSIYPGYKIHGYLLWLNDFSLEEVL